MFIRPSPKIYPSSSGITELSVFHCTVVTPQLTEPNMLRPNRDRTDVLT